MDVVRTYELSPREGVARDDFLRAMFDEVMPAVNSGVTRGGEVRSLALFQRTGGSYVWLVELNGLGGTTRHLPGFARECLESAAEALSKVADATSFEDLIPVLQA